MSTTIYLLQRWAVASLTGDNDGSTGDAYVNGGPRTTSFTDEHDSLSGYTTRFCKLQVIMTRLTWGHNPHNKWLQWDCHNISHRKNGLLHMGLQNVSRGNQDPPCKRTMILPQRGWSQPIICGLQHALD